MLNFKFGFFFPKFYFQCLTSLSVVNYKIWNILKRLTVEWNAKKYEPQRSIQNVIGVHMVLLTIKCSRSFWGHSAFAILQQLHISKMAGYRAQQTESWHVGILVTHIACIRETFDLIGFKVICCTCLKMTSQVKNGLPYSVHHWTQGH